MASPKAHALPTAVLAVVSAILYTPLMIMSKNLFILGAVIFFGFFIDFDHLPFGRLWQALKNGGLKSVIRSWQEEGWLDPNHVDFFHTWWMLLVIVLFSIFIGNWLPFISYAIHVAFIDGGSLDQLDYPKCSPLSRDFLKYFALRFYPKWALYHTAGLPEKRVSKN